MSIARLTLRHSDGTTPVLVGDGVLEAFATEIGEWLGRRKVFVVTSPRVWNLHGESLEALLSGAAAARRLEVPEGEAAKSAATAERLWGEMLTHGGKRDSRVIAFGGGSVGDVAGFAAGCFLRGISFLQIPTTLLAQVDAAIGGKTGINLPAAKHSVGLFYQPWATLSDTRFLETLPAAELRSGLLEVVKAGVVLDADLFERLEDELDGLLHRTSQLLAPVVAHAAKAKIDVVERDPHEHDLRRLLNFGHTLGHALEAKLAYRGLRHGEAVGYGMLFAVRLAARRELDAAACGRIQGLISRFELPPLPALDPEDLLSSIAYDKKTRESGTTWVLPTRIGAGKAISGIEKDEILAELGVFVNDPLAAI